MMTLVFFLFSLFSQIVPYCSDLHQQRARKMALKISACGLLCPQGRTTTGTCTWVIVRVRVMTPACAGDGCEYWFLLILLFHLVSIFPSLTPYPHNPRTQAQHTCPTWPPQPPSAVLEQSKRNCVRFAVRCAIRDTIRIAVVVAIVEPIRKTEWGSNSGPKWCAVRASVVETSKRCAVKQSKRNCVRRAVQWPRDTIKIAIVAAITEPIRKIEWGSIGGSKRCAVSF